MSVVGRNRGAPGGTRTRDKRFRKPLLCPLSYWGLDTKLGRKRASFGHLTAKLTATRITVSV